MIHKRLTLLTAAVGLTLTMGCNSTNMACNGNGGGFLSRLCGRAKTVTVAPAEAVPVDAGFGAGFGPGFGMGFGMPLHSGPVGDAPMCDAPVCDGPILMDRGPMGIPNLGHGGAPFPGNGFAPLPPGNGFAAPATPYPPSISPPPGSVPGTPPPGRLTPTPQTQQPQAQPMPFSP